MNPPCQPQYLRAFILEVKMLILTRKTGESLFVGDDVEITVLSVRGNQVKLGVNAPKEISVHRQEIYQRIKKAEENPPEQEE